MCIFTAKGAWAVTNKNRTSFLWKVDGLECSKSLSHRFCFRLLWCGVGLIVFLLSLSVAKNFYPEIENGKWVAISAGATGLTIAIPIIGLMFDRKIKQLLQNNKKF